MPKKPKGMKDPVFIMGKWEERVTPPPTAGTTMVNINDPNVDEESRKGLRGVTFRKAEKQVVGSGRASKINK